MALVQTYGGTVRVISGVVPLGCCCTDCLDYTLTIDYTEDPCGCYDFSLVMDPLATTTISSYAWDFDDGGSSTSAAPSHCFATNGTYVVSVTTIDAEGCSKTTTVEIVVTCLSGCGACDDDMPDEVTVTIPTMTDKAGANCAACDNLGGTYVVPRQAGVNCRYVIGNIIPSDPPDMGACADLGTTNTYIEIEVHYHHTVTVGGVAQNGHRIIFRYGEVGIGTRFIEWTVAADATDLCRTDYVMDFESESGTNYCDATGTTASVSA